MSPKMSPNASAKPPKPSAPAPRMFGSTPAWPYWSYAARFCASLSISYASFASLNFASAVFAASPWLRSGWYFIRSDPGVAVLVVRGALLRVAQHLVRFLRLLELRLGGLRRVTLVAVRVVLHPIGPRRGRTGRTRRASARRSASRTLPSPP